MKPQQEVQVDINCILISRSRTLLQLQADILKEVTTITNVNTESANNALKITKNLGEHLIL